jgi:HEAT repeat protein
MGRFLLALAFVAAGEALARADSASAPDPERVLRDIVSADYETRNEALMDLQLLDPAILTKLAPRLVDIFADRHQTDVVRGSVAIVLGQTSHRRALDPVCPRILEFVMDRTMDVQSRTGALMVLDPCVRPAIGDDDEPAGAAKIEREVTKVLADKSESPMLRGSAVALLLAPQHAHQDPAPLLRILGDEHEPTPLRATAATALGNYSRPPAGVVEALAAVVGSKDNPNGLRRAASIGLSMIGNQASQAIPALVATAEDRDADPQLRFFALRTLGKIQDPGNIDTIFRIAGTDERREELRLNAIALMWTAPRERWHETLGMLLPILTDTGHHTRAANALWSISQLAEKAVDVGEVSVLPQLEVAKDVPLDGDPAVEQHRKDLENRIAALKRMSPRGGLRSVLTRKPYVTAGVGYGLAAILVSLLLLWLRPWWIFRFNRAVRPWVEFKLPTRLGGVTVPLQTLLGVGLFRHHRRVLDAWVASHVVAARQAFARRTTVRDRRVHVPLPLLVDGQLTAAPSAAAIRPTFARSRAIVLIAGEGGVGKTSLACELGRWAMADDVDGRLCRHLMLPVLLEHDIEPGHLLDAIKGQLQLLIGDDEPVDTELLRILLQRRRLLVIVDRYSELSDATRRAVRPAAADFPVGALLLTSRHEEVLEGAPAAVLRPFRIAGNRLATFMEAYLGQRGARERFDDPAFFDACRRLSELVGQRDVTVLLARLFADRLVDTKVAGGDLPENVPDLMLDYLNHLNASVAEERLDDRVVQRAATLVAWLCVEQGLVPGDADRDRVISELGAPGEPTVDYLERRLRLVRTVGAARDRLRFSLDPVAEYLAAWDVCSRIGNDEAAWRLFIAQRRQTTGPEALSAFLAKLRDCLEARHGARQVFSAIDGEMTSGPS